MFTLIDNLPIQIPYDAIVAFCQKWGVTEFALFGSVLRDDFTPKSDVDILLTFAPDARYDLFDLVDMQEELESAFGRLVDVMDRRAVDRSYNYIRKQDVLNTYRVVYAS